MKNTRPLKVLQIVDALGMGGAETWLMEILRLWSRSGAAQIHFLCTGGGAGIFDDEARMLGAHIHYVPYGRDRLLRFVRTFRKILRDERYDAIHDHQGYASGWHFLMGVGRLPKIRISHLHNASYQIRREYGVTASRRLALFLGRILMRCFATHILGVSRSLVQAYGFDGPTGRRQRNQILRCGFRSDRFLGDQAEARASVRREFSWPEDAKVILFAGRIDRSADPGDLRAQKNAPFALKVGLCCTSKDQQARMLFAGKLSAAVPLLEKQIAEAGSAGRIVFAGIRRDIETLMLGCDVLLFPSRGEGLGMVAVEAQAAGLPVIASTAVPKECVVIHELVRLLSLSENLSTWVRATLEALHSPRLNPVVCNAKIGCSAFSIEISAALLRSVYAGHSR